MRSFIFGTDWGEDVDDCVAMRLLVRAHKEGKINLLGVGINTRCKESAPSLYAFLKNEGASFPIGVDKDVCECLSHVTYQKILAPMVPELSNDDFEDSVRLYRRLISDSEGKIEIIEVGFLQVIAKVLLSGPDDISPLCGRELFEKKVSKVWCMGGKWDTQGGSEYNFSRYDFAKWGAHSFVNNCPVPVTYLGWEVGANLITGDCVDESDLLFSLIKAHSGGPGRESWDPMLVHIAIVGNESEAGYDIKRGVASCDEDGKNYFLEKEGGKDAFVIKREPDSYYKEQINMRII